MMTKKALITLLRLHKWLEIFMLDYVLELTPANSLNNFKVESTITTFHPSHILFLRLLNQGDCRLG